MLNCYCSVLFMILNLSPFCLTFRAMNLTSEDPTTIFLLQSHDNNASQSQNHQTSIRSNRETGSLTIYNNKFRPSFGPPSRDNHPSTDYQAYQETYPPLAPDTVSTSYQQSLASDLGYQESISGQQDHQPYQDGYQETGYEYQGDTDLEQQKQHQQQQRQQQHQYQPPPQPSSVHPWGLTVFRQASPRPAFHHSSPHDVSGPRIVTHRGAERRPGSNPHEFHSVVNYGLINVHHGDHYEPHHNAKDEEKESKPESLAAVKEMDAMKKQEITTAAPDVEKITEQNALASE